MPNVNDLFPSKYLKASDLKGREPSLVIAKVGFEPVGVARDMKAVLYFEGQKKGLVLNKINAKRITQNLNSGATEDWLGKKIKLFATTCDYQGEDVECIRVRDTHHATTPAPAARSRKRIEPAPEPVEPPLGGDDDDDAPPLTDDDIPF